MRRSDREVADKSEIVEIIDKCEVCRLAFSDNNIPYIVPMNFGYSYEEGKLTLYFHGASEGRKHDMIKKNPVASFEMDCSHKLIEAEEAGDYSMEFESVIGSGNIKYCTEKADKTHALKQLMKQYAKDREFTFPDHVMDSVTVFKLEVEEFAGKRLKKS